jgi:uncharacterized RDD family membrane protein YckC
MKCPKCGYLGFETTDRCRNCGYDFSLAAPAPAAELPLQMGHVDEPLSDLQLAPVASGDVAGDDGAFAAPRRGRARRTPGGAETRSSDGAPLPLFGAEDLNDVPLITAPRPPRAPLAVRRTTPDIPKGRSAPPRAAAAVTASIAPATTGPAAEDAPRSAAAEASSWPSTTVHAPAGRLARVLATAADLLLLVLIDALVIYLTLALLGLEAGAWAALPLGPLLAFLALLDGGYLVAFVAAGGQTIGKMMSGVRVIGDNGERVDIGSAILRAGGCGLSLLTAGLGYLPAFVTADGRALHDRLAGTRVVRAR